ncbi:MAG: agmatinase [Pseudomonadota bacterium]
MTTGYQPLSGMEVPRFAGIATFMRLPHVKPADADDVDIGLIGVPWDGGTTNRAGPRHGPRQIRDMSAMTRHKHHVFRFSPFDLCNVADLGDTGANPVDVMDGMNRIETFFRDVIGRGIIPLTAGGDHLISLPILKAVGEKAPVAMIHFDAHTDLFDGYFEGFKFTHGTPFRRAIEDGVLNPEKTIQIGLRGSAYDFADREYGEAKGVRLMDIEEAVALGTEKVMEEARALVGDDPVYVSFDIDCIDPAFAPGTGTPEVGGFTTREAQALLRGLRGLNIVGADVVEVSPPFDPSGYTALAGATMMFELLCVMAEGVASRKAG